MIRSLVVPVAALWVSSACELDQGGADAGPDCAPAGTYTLTYSLAADPGTCQGAQAPAARDMTIDGDDACGRNTTQVQQTDANGCVTSGTVSFVGTRGGLSDGTMKVTVTCPQRAGCTVNYSIYFQRR